MSWIYRLYKVIWAYPTPAKTEDALKIGLLGASKIAPIALVLSAKQHAEVIVQAVAARDKKRATEYAKKHGIPQVFDSYQALLDDPNIDAIYNPLPNGLHYEWTLKALAAGKHVLLEKPSVSTTTEAEALFNSPLLQGPSAPILLEAVHYRFQPSWDLFLSSIDRSNIAHVYSTMTAPALLISKDDIRFQYDLAGGAMMDLMYPLSYLRHTFGTEPEACTSCTVQTMPPDNLCDYAFEASWRFPGGATAVSHGDMQARLWDALPFSWPRVEVTHKPVVVDDPSLPPGQVQTRTRKVTIVNPIVPAIWHRIDIEDTFEVRSASDGTGPGSTAAEGPVVKTWTRKETKRAYTWGEAGHPERASEAHWLSYRYRLEAFVDRIRGRPGSGVWIDAQDSINQIKAGDMAYEKAGLPLRPTSNFQLPQAWR